MTPKQARVDMFFLQKLNGKNGTYGFEDVIFCHLLDSKLLILLCHLHFKMAGLSSPFIALLRLQLMHVYAS